MIVFKWLNHICDMCTFTISIEVFISLNSVFFLSKLLKFYYIAHSNQKMPKLLMFNTYASCVWTMLQLTHFCSVKFLAWKSGIVKNWQISCLRRDHFPSEVLSAFLLRYPPTSIQPKSTILPTIWMFGQGSLADPIPPPCTLKYTQYRCIKMY